MIRRLPLLLALAAWPAQADDFTGFYAGVNAGYGWERDSHVQPGSSITRTTPASRVEADSALPPSASAAATSLQRSGKALSR